MEVYDSIIIGGGIAGLQAAIQLGRYEHRVLVIDSGYGRSTLCRQYHNVLGWPEGISGEELRRRGRVQAEAVGVQFISDEVVQAAKKTVQGEGFSLLGKSGAGYEALTLLLATGLVDRFPDIPGLRACLGLTVYVCPDCDGFELKGKQTIVLGAGDVGAEMCVVLSDWTSNIIYVNHDKKPVKDELKWKLNQLGVAYFEEGIKEIFMQGEGMFQGVKLNNDELLHAERGFIAFGGNEVKSELAKQLGVERHENKHIPTDPRSKLTNVPHIWAAGDIGVHAEQVTVAMGEGQLAAIWIHKALKKLEAENKSGVQLVGKA
jgi:thioredoxin reductase (NADPH)